jgi:hypothetical protein
MTAPARPTTAPGGFALAAVALPGAEARTAGEQQRCLSGRCQVRSGWLGSEDGAARYGVGSVSMVDRAWTTSAVVARYDMSE